MAVETIGERSRQRATGSHQYSPELPKRTGIAMHLYKPPEIPDRLSALPVGRHRPEYILSQGEKTHFTMLDNMHTTNSVIKAPSMTEGRLPPILPIRSLPQRFPQPKEELTKLDPGALPATVFEPQPVAPKRITPLGTTHRVARGRARVPEMASPATATELFVTSSDTTRLLDSSSFASSEPDISQPLLDSGKVIRSHHDTKRRRIPRAVVAATTAIALAGGLIGGLAILRKHSPAQPDQKPVVLVIPHVPSPFETQPQPVVVPITETATISAQDGNQWNTAARKTTDALGHASIPVTNIVAQMEAYDSRTTSPNPDAAQTGDTVITLTKPAIQLVDQLQNLPSDASQAEVDAAKMIYQLNNLSPMDIQTLIAQYGDKLEELKNDITDILTPPAEKASYQAPQGSKRTTQTALATEKKSGEATPKQTTIFSFFADKTKSVLKRDPLTKAKKANAALAADRQRRLGQPSYAI